MVMNLNLLTNRELIRSQINNLVKDMSEERLFITPPKLSNNMLWIFGHLIRSTDYLTLRLAGEKMNFPENLDSYFAKGSSTKDWQDTNGLKDKIFAAEKHCREALDKFLTPDKMNSNLAENYKTSMGMNLKTVSDAVEYATIHEVLHLGQLQIYKKLTE